MKKVLCENWYDPIYRRNFYVFIEEDWEKCRKFMRTKLSEPCEVERADNFADAIMFPVSTSWSDLAGIAFWFPRKAGWEASTYAHEAVHACNMVFDKCGIKANYENDEAQAYYVEYITKNIESAIKNLRRRTAKANKKKRD